MRRKLATLTLFFLAFGSTMSFADSPGAGGKKTGKVDRAKLFDRMDANGDGKLTKEEYRSFLESAKSKVQAKTGKAAKAGGKGGKLADKIFEMMDTNKDGVVSKEEFLKFDPSTARRAKGKGRKN